MFGFLDNESYTFYYKKIIIGALYSTVSGHSKEGSLLSRVIPFRVYLLSQQLVLVSYGGHKMFKFLLSMINVKLMYIYVIFSSATDFIKVIKLGQLQKKRQTTKQ